MGAPMHMHAATGQSEAVRPAPCASCPCVYGRPPAACLQMLEEQREEADWSRQCRGVWLMGYWRRLSMKACGE